MAFVTFFLFVTFMDRVSRYSRGLGAIHFDNNSCLLFVEDGFIEPQTGLKKVCTHWESAVNVQFTSKNTTWIPDEQTKSLTLLR